MNLEKYIGLPYQENGRTWQGVDCWGLARLYYKHELNIDLPDYSDLYSGSWDEQVTKLIEVHKEGWQQVQDPKPGDLCLFNIYGEPAHVGVYIGNHKFLHSRDGLDSVIESLNSPQWKKRLDGFFRYQEAGSVQITGSPHPLKLAHAVEWTAAGTAIEDLVNFISKKYSIGKNLKTRIIIVVDGVPVPQQLWASTVLQHGQQVSYRTLAQGRNGTRLILTIAVVIAAIAVGEYVAGMEAVKALAASSPIAAKAVVAAAMAATTMAGTALVNAIAPIRMPGAGSDPGQPNQLNLFNGASNQINRLGAIPVVLGRVRYTGLLGATPYIETHTTTNILNLLIIWGFGPLYVDPKSINVGALNLEEAFYDGSKVTVEQGGSPVRTLMGTTTEDSAQVELFNKLYPTDVEQIFKNVELTNNPEDGNDWQEIEFLQTGTRVDIAFNFPEGMRKIKTKGSGAGEIGEATCSIEIQIARADSTYEDVPALSPAGGSTQAIAFSDTLSVQPFTTFDPYSADGYFSSATLYRWYDICIGPGGSISSFAGAPTLNPDQEPSLQVIEWYRAQNYDLSTPTYTRFPTIPADHIRLYRVCLASSQGLLPDRTVSYLQTGYVGLALSYVNETVPGMDESGTPIATGVVRLNISGGRYYPDAAPTPTAPSTTTIFVATPATVPNSETVAEDRYWTDFLKENAIWSLDNSSEFTRTIQIQLPKSGVYDFTGAADDEAVVTIGNVRVLEIPSGGYKDVATEAQYFNAGTYSMTISAKNSGGGKAGFALKVTFTSNSGANIPTSPKTIFTLGTAGVFAKRKDPFNYVYSVPNLPKAKYKLRVRRYDQEIEETTESEYRYFSKVVLSNAISFDNKLPMSDLPRGKLARTAIKVQSNAKNNGQVDGINAVVQTISHDWDRASQQWIPRATNNPASLFLHVLTHPANAYRLADPNSPNFYAEISQKVDLEKLIEWHNFCNPINPTPNNPVLAYNAVLTSTQSVMDTLRDICAAGKASPMFVDGKWTVVIDKPREYVVQHFTPHNSWGFEATKTLPRLPHAFRVTIQDEQNAYQAKEIYVYNYGYSEYGNEPGKKAAEIFEELSLPGVTNEIQARHLAQWHLAQLKLRPETYTINTDFEFLVCNRGDLVKVTHDVPLWGIGSGRIKSVNRATKTLELTESLALDANPSPNPNRVIRIRTSAGISKTLTLTRTTSAGIYNSITTVEEIPADVESDNLFMLGNENYETQDLIVLSIEPTTNLSARITLTDYSSEIYTTDLSNELVFKANITKPTTGVAQTTITSAPNILSVTSNRATSRQVSTGTYETGALISFANPAELTSYAKFVQFELVRGSEQFSITAPATIHNIVKESGNYQVYGLDTGAIYKVRARYSDALGSVFGPWSDTVMFVGGPAGAETTPATLELKLEGTYIVAYPRDFDLPSDFKTYEYRLIKDSGTEDFWDLDPLDLENNIQVTQSIVEGRFNIMDQPSPRLSENGITYKVACRVVTRTNEYSDTSAVDTIVVTTIKYAT